MKKIIRSNAFFSSVQRVVLEMQFSKIRSIQVSVLAITVFLQQVVTIFHICHQLIIYRFWSFPQQQFG
ncbi:MULTISPECIES: hypothetical protein [Nostocales]|jgi:hypothetical protein|uniref:hypothetical protein n=1 Tax=Nostocales TaxID=1161 RepID=UPI000ADCB20E|nr:MULTISPECIES: hypothetical protein [Nostocales]QSV73942.1 MAG: hypothetical protein HEQ20_28135 [Aphanizomenon flos-aquae KM1D3_PB]